MESGVITLTGLDERTRTNEVAIARVDERVDSIEDRLDRGAKALYFAGAGMFTLAAAVIGVIGIVLAG